MTSEPKEKPINSSAAQSSPSAPQPAKPATQPAKQEPEAPPFEKEIVSQIKSHFGNDKIKVSYIRPLRIKINVDPNDTVEVATFIRDNLGFDHAEAVSGTDYPKDKQLKCSVYTLKVILETNDLYYPKTGRIYHL